VQEKYAAVSLKKRPKDHRRARRNFARAIVKVSIAVRKLGFTNAERKRLIDRVNKTVDSMRSLDRQAGNLERKADATRSEDQKKEYRRQARAVRSEMRSSKSKPASCSRRSSAPSAKSSRATWTPSRPSAS